MPLARGSVVRIDAETNQLTAAIETGPAYEFPMVAVGEGAVWTREYEGGRTVTQIDPETNTMRRTVQIVGEATDITVGGGSVWVTSSLDGDGVLVEIAADTGRFRRAVSLGYSGLTAVAVDPGAIWVAAAGTDGNVALRIEPTTGEVVAAIPLSDQPWDIAVGEGAVWLVGGRTQDSQVEPGTLWRIDPDTNHVVATVELPGPVSGRAIATGAGGVWVHGHERVAGWVSTLLRIDPATNQITGRIEARNNDADVAVGKGSVWVVNEEWSTVRRIDPATNEVIATIDIEGACGCSVAVGAGGVWAS